MAHRLRTWLRRRLNFRGKKRSRAFGTSLQQTATPSKQQDFPPPPYNTLDHPSPSTHELPSSIDGSESLEVLRARNPATPFLRPPRDETRPLQATELAAQAAVIRMLRALDEPNPTMVAARTAQAIAVAVSTTRSYAAFVAAVTAAESSALLLVEDHRDNSQRDRCRSRQTNALEAATHAAMVADAGIKPIVAWPFSIYDIHRLTSSSQTGSLLSE
ncbi:hypothetical protein KVR01_008232 [Diaporthe batatas]|uniref:uncharacterized protein n=1 Tax=Diaporthe batatas TaxID=748121 RepID=UPI001D037683|nr:uncharacterized protein KVR01_008232 [Diaporthe batatas]KAG8162467.1 hypothetical protein KVR01_008232 [Diaporthe batatas]